MMFSIIVPIYNVEEYLEKCINSILNQTFRDFELILVDDGSPDNCPKICDEFAKRDFRIRVIHQENQGLVAARNIGVKNAVGDFICYVDGDDWVRKNWLNTMYEVIKKSNPDIIVFSAIKKYINKEEEIPFNINEGFYNKEELVKHIYPYMIYDKRLPFCKGLIFPVAWNKIYRATLLKRHFCKDTKIRMGEDNAFVFEICYYANSIYFINEIFYIYNQLNVNSITSNYDSNRFSNNKILIKYIESNLYGKEEYLDEQINAFKAYWLIMAIFHEVKFNISFLSLNGYKTLFFSKYSSQPLPKTQIISSKFDNSNAFFIAFNLSYSI